MNRNFLAATILATIVGTSTYAGTISIVDQPTNIQRLDISVDDFYLDGALGVGTTVVNPVDTPKVFQERIDGREGLDGGFYIQNNDAQRMVWNNAPNEDTFWLRVTDANDQNPQSRETFSWTVNIGDTSLSLGDRLPNGNVQWLEIAGFGSIDNVVFDTGMRSDGYSVEAFTPISPIPLPASALLLFGAMGGLGYVARKRKS